MRFQHHLLALAPFALAATAEAQTPLFQFDGASEFIDRGTIGVNQNGYFCERWSLNHYLGGVQNLRTFSCVVQDQNCATLENLQFALFDEALDAAGARTGTPAEANPLVLTLIATGPGCPTGQTTGAAAFIFTIGPATGNVVNGPFVRDAFTGILLEADAGWPGSDGLAGQASFANVTQGVSPEQPSAGALVAYANPGFPRNSTRVDFFRGNGGGPARARYGTFWSSSNQRLNLEGIVARMGAEDSTGAWSSLTTVSPENYGLAGRFPDVRNLGGSATPRRDNLLFDVLSNGTFSSGLSLVILSSRLATQTIGAQVPLPGIGVLALDPTDPVFTATAPGVPGLVLPIAGPTNNFRVDLGAIQARGAFSVGQTFYAQVLNVDLTTGAAGLSNLVSFSIL